MLNEYQPINVVNYLAIVSLEKIGNFTPTEKEISMMEKVLSTSIKASMNKYKNRYLVKPESIDQKRQEISFLEDLHMAAC